MTHNSGLGIKPQPSFIATNNNNLSTTFYIRDPTITIITITISYQYHLIRPSIHRRSPQSLYHLKDNKILFLIIYLHFPSSHHHPQRQAVLDANFAIFLRFFAVPLYQALHTSFIPWLAAGNNSFHPATTIVYLPDRKISTTTHRIVFYTDMK